MTKVEFLIKSQIRFDDVGEPIVDDAGESELVDYEYRGYNYVVSAGGVEFAVRTYDDEPGTVIVMRPPNGAPLPIGKPLVAFLQQGFSAAVIKIYDSQAGFYRSVNPTTLAFEE